MPTPEGFTTRPVGLDFTAVMLTGAAAGVDMAMLAELLPAIEAAVMNPEPDGDIGDEEEEAPDGD